MNRIDRLFAVALLLQSKRVITGVEIARHFEIRLCYVALDQKQTERVVEPLGVVLYQNFWYLVAWCRLRRGIRSFRLDRARELALLSERFPIRRDFDLEAHLRSAFSDSEMRTVRLWFARDVADRAVRELGPCVRAQKTAGGGMEISALDWGCEWMLRWILSSAASRVGELGEPKPDSRVALPDTRFRLHLHPGAFGGSCLLRETTRLPRTASYIQCARVEPIVSTAMPRTSFRSMRKRLHGARPQRSRSRPRSPQRGNFRGFEEFLAAAATSRPLHLRFVCKDQPQLDETVREIVEEIRGSVEAFTRAPCGNGQAVCELRFVPASAISAAEALICLMKLGSVSVERADCGEE